jgi:hypothetical protein
MAEAVGASADFDFDSRVDHLKGFGAGLPDLPLGRRDCRSTPSPDDSHPCVVD